MALTPTGPIPADILIIGDAPSQWDVSKGSIFSGEALGNLLLKAGLLKTSCFITALVDSQPPNDDINEWLSDRKTCPGPGWIPLKGKWVSPEIALGIERIYAQLQEIKPRLIIALGPASLFALTGKMGIQKWRGSRLSVPDTECPVLPTYSPYDLKNSPELEPILVSDLKRAKAVYEGTQNPRRYQFLTAPTFEDASETLDYLLALADSQPGNQLLPLAGDLETRAGHIACFGIAWSASEALCIPILRASTTDPFYWSEDQEVILVAKLQTLFRHPKILWLGQNYLYDCQYFERFWGFLPLNVYDTMIAHHAMYSNMRKGLDFLSSLYAEDHIYWKDESKEWDASLGEEQLWIYNCKDCCVTWEIYPKIRAEGHNDSPTEEKWRAHQAFQQSLFFPVLRMMTRGLRRDVAQIDRLRSELMQAGLTRQDNLDLMAGHHLNPRSPKQLIAFFYHDLGLPVIRALQTDKTTTNANAMAQIAAREPALLPLCQTIVELKSIGVFLSTFINASPDTDGKMRSSFSVAGPTTYRFASYENAFGSGMNFQNIPVEEKQKIKSPTYIKLPNIRKIFIPDPGFTYFDMDLDRADLQVVVWEADDKELKEALHKGIDMHCLSACQIFDIKGIPYEELTETHPNYSEHRGRIGKPRRDKAKVGVHATDYGVGDDKLSQALGITRREAGDFRAKWFAAHPGIKQWHRRTVNAVEQFGFIENQFGARLHLFGRFSLPEFLGWLPQSTVAGVINRILVKIDAEQQAGNLPVELQIQVHDSLAGQFPTGASACLPRMRALADSIVIPYPDPLVIPVGFKTSTISWGDCK